MKKNFRPIRVDKSFWREHIFEKREIFGSLDFSMKSLNSIFYANQWSWERGTVETWKYNEITLDKWELQVTINDKGEKKLTFNADRYWKREEKNVLKTQVLSKECVMVGTMPHTLKSFLLNKNSSLPFNVAMSEWNTL